MERSNRVREYRARNWEDALTKDVGQSVSRTGTSSDSMQRIMTAAIETFGERGYHGTTTRDIAARANLSAAGIYMHYRSKGELLESIMRTTHNDILADLRGAFQQHVDPVNRIAALVRAHVAFHAKHHTAARVANHELEALEPRVRAEILGVRAEIENLFQEAIKLGMDSGAFEVQHLRTTTFAVLSLGIGVSRWFSEDGRLAPEALGEIYAELTLRSLSSRTSPDSSTDAAQPIGRTAID